MQLAADDRVATRPDGDATIEAGFFGPEDARLFGSLHIPLGSPTAGVLVCSPLHADFVKNYRSEVQLARRLADRGFAVLRFHYRGQGHSDREPSDITFSSLVDDAVLALEDLRSRTGVERVGFMGCRLGGLVAAAAASKVEGAPLVLWEPVVRPDSYVREAIRSKTISALSGSATNGMSSEALMRSLDEQGSMDIHGYPIFRDLVRSLEGRSLAGEVGDEPRPVHVIQISRGSAIRRDLAEVADDWSQLGFAADVRRVSGDVAWWFRGAGSAREEPEALTNEVVTDSADWMTVQLESTSKT